MEKRAGREEEKTKKEEGMTLLDVVTALNTLLWIQFLVACGCVLLGQFISFERCFFILSGLIFALNAIATMQLEARIRKEEEHE